MGWKHYGTIGIEMNMVDMLTSKYCISMQIHNVKDQLS